MCIIRPFRYMCCDRTYFHVIKIQSSCPDSWPLEKCPPELCMWLGTTNWKARLLLDDRCWRCKAVSEGLFDEQYQARRPVIDTAFVVEGLENCTPERRRERAEHAGNCWFCGSSSDGVRDCESCNGTGSSAKGKKKSVEHVQERPAKKKRRTSAAVAEGRVSKPRRGRPPGGGKKKKLAAIREESQMNLAPSPMDGNNAMQQEEFHPDTPAYPLDNHSWEPANQHADSTLPSYGINLDHNPYGMHSNNMPAFTSNQTPLQYGTMANYAVNPQEMDLSTLSYQDHLQPSIEFDHDASHGEFKLDDVGEGVRSDPNLDFGNHYEHFPTDIQHSHDANFLTHDWPDYPDGLLYPSYSDTNNEFAPALHDTPSAAPVAPIAQMTVDRFSPQRRYLPSPALSEAHIAQHAPQDTSGGPAVPTSTPASTANLAANTAAISSISFSRLATPP